MKKTSALFAALLLAGLLAPASQADTVCAACEYDTGAEGSYLGSFNPATHDSATYQHLSFSRGRFNDFWVFDVGPGDGRASVIVAALGSLTLFAAQLFQDAGSTCPSFACTSIGFGSLLDGDASLDGALTIFESLPAGRYVLHVTGVIAPPRENIYRGFLDLDPLSMREAGSLALFGLGLGALGFAIRRHQR
jgi:hypothetical protein